MRQKSTLLIVGALWLALIINCNQREARIEQSQNNVSNSIVVSPTPTSEIDRVLAIPANFKPSYKILQVRDVSSGIASRFVVNISLPKDSTKDVVEGNLRYAAKSQYEKTKPDAMQILLILKDVLLTHQILSAVWNLHLMEIGGVLTKDRRSTNIKSCSKVKNL